MGDRGKRLLGLIGKSSDSTSGVDMEKVHGSGRQDGRAEEVDEDSEGKQAAMEELHDAHAADPPDHARAARAMGDFMDLHMARKGART